MLSKVFLSQLRISIFIVMSIKQQYILSIGESKLAIEITSNFFIQKLSISNVQSLGIDPKIALTAIMLLSSYYADQKQ